MYSRTDYDGMTPEQLHGRISALWIAVKGVPRNSRDVFQIVCDELASMRDIIDRIATEYPSVVTPCECGKGEACSKCEITYLLNEFALAHSEHEVG